MQQKIPIENLYYLLCYAWGVSDQLDWVKVDSEYWFPAFSFRDDV